MVFVIVRSRDELPSLDPSKMIQSAPFKMKRAVADEPVIETASCGCPDGPPRGLMVTVLVELAPAIELIVIGKTSPVACGSVV